MSDDPKTDSSTESKPAPSVPPGPEKPSVPQQKRRFKRDPDQPLSDDEEALAGRRNRRGATVSEPEGDPGEEDDLENEIERLNARVRALAARKKASGSAENESRGAKYHKLTRKAASSAAAAPRDPDAPEPAAPVALPAPRPVMYHVAGYATEWNPGWLLASAGVVVLGLLAFWLGRLSIKPPAAGSKETTVPVVTAVWSPTDIERLDKVLAADAEGKLAEAQSLAENLAKPPDARPDLGRYLSVLQARRGGVNDAEADLVRAASPYLPPLAIAAVQDRLGFIYARRRDFKIAGEAFASAAAADPFNAATFYRWGEALRRQGRLLDAIAKFQEALLRLPATLPENDSLRQCAAFRQRLTLIELGNDAEVKTAIDAQLNLPAPSIYWLLTAVAYDLQHNDVPGALATVQRAKVVSSGARIDPLLNDYFLRSLAARSKETVGFVAEMTTEHKQQLNSSAAYFVDP